jgi:hypothetical protein
MQETINNAIESPSIDGGGAVLRETANLFTPEYAAQCSNSPRTFLNEDSCLLSFEETACIPARSWDDEQYLPEFYLNLSSELLREIYTETGGGVEGTKYLYAIDGLRVEEDPDVDPPCERQTTSRWIPVSCTGEASSLHPKVADIFGQLLTYNDDDNEFVRDVWNWSDEECPASEYMKKGFEVEDLNGTCWRNVHPDHLNVYDFTPWTLNHPGGPARIKQFALNGLTTLMFPASHEMVRWSDNKYDFGTAGRLGDTISFYDLPSSLRNQQLFDLFGFSTETITYTPSNGVIVCGSPFEVANDPFLGGSQGRGAFDSLNSNLQFTDNEDFLRQKRIVWTEAVLNGEDQLRQRVAWALSQILVISPNAIDEGELVTESMTAFYDIFVS